MLDGFPSLTIGAIRTLAEHRQWVLWRMEPRDGKITKVPYSPATHRPCSSTQPRDWGSYQEVVEAALKHDGQPYSGPGFVFNGKAANRIMGVDLDKCRDVETGRLDPWAEKIVERFESYTELSPSGRGVHILVFGRLPEGAAKRITMPGGAGIECYDTGRYFTVTGQHLDGTPEEIEDRQADVEWLCEHIASLRGRKPAPPAEANGHALNGHHLNGHALNGHDLKTETPESASAAKATKGPPPRLGDGLEAELDPHARADAAVDRRLIDALCANNEKFRETWERKREDVKDWSHSEYDLALASWMVTAGWAPIEIMRGLIEHRRKFGADLKLNRNPPSYYYANTIRAARRGHEIDEAQDALRDHVATRAQLAQAGARPDRDSVLSALGVIYGCEIKAVSRYSGDEPGYSIMTDHGEIKGTVEMLMSQPRLINALVAVTGTVISKCKPREHERRIQSLLDVADKVDVGPDAKTMELIRYWLNDYLTTREVSVQNGVISNAGDDPFMAEGRYYVAASAFAKWLREQKGQTLTVQRIALELRKLGCSPKQLSVDTGQRKASRQFWAVHPNIFA